MAENKRSKKIVVLGAGYAGLGAILDLAASYRRGGLKAELTLIDRNPFHQLITWLHLTATEALPAHRAYLPLAQLIPTDIVTVMQANVEAIDPNAHTVLTSSGDVPFDRLVIALGSETTAPPIPGWVEFTFPLRWWSDAERLRKHIRQQFAHAGRSPSQTERRRRVRFVVVGGGFTGCQLVGELAHWVTALADEYGVPITDIHLILLEAASCLLPGWERSKSEHAACLLRRKGIDVRMNCKLEKVEPAQVTFSGETLSTHTVVWVGGIRAPSLLAESGLPTGQQGRVLTDAYLRVIKAPEIYVAGDSALFVKDGQLLPATAACALRQGAYVATAIVNEANGQPLAPYRPSQLGMFVSLGGNDAVGDVFGVSLQGFAAGVVKESIERWYLSTVAAKAFH